MSELMTVRGFVATEPRLKKIDNDTEALEFRLACSERWFDREKNTWVDGQTNWFSVTAYRELARNAGMSFKKGEKVIVVGRLKIRNYTRQDGNPGTFVGLDAITMGHDLTWAGALVVHKSYPPRTQANAAENASGTATDDSAANNESSATENAGPRDGTVPEDQVRDREADDAFDEETDSEREHAFA